MKKSILLAAAIVLSAGTMLAQQVLYQQDFENYGTSTEWELVQGDPTFAVGKVAGIDNTTNMMSSSDVKQSILKLNSKTFEGPFIYEVESYPSFNFAGPIVNYVDNDNFVVVTIDNNDKRVRVRQVVNGTWDADFPVGDGNDWRFWVDADYVTDTLSTEVLGGWTEGASATLKWKLLVDPDEGTLTVYLNGNLILEDVSVVLPQYTATVGMYTWWCRHAFDNIKISEPASEPVGNSYAQDFEAAGAGSEWVLKQGDPTFAVGAVTWATIDNTTKMLNSGDVKQSIMALSGYEFEGPFTYEIETYPSFNFAGPIVNYVDNDNFVVVTIDNNDKRVRVRQVVNGVWDADFPVGDGDAWRFWVDADYVTDTLSTEVLGGWTEGASATLKWKLLVNPDEGTLTVFLNGNLILKDVSVVLPQYKAQIGIYTWWCRHAIDNIKVTEGIDDTSTPRISQSIEIKAYPNPVTNGILNIDTRALNGDAVAKVFNLLGSEMMSHKITTGDIQQIDTRNLVPGIYFINIRDGKGLNATQKFVVR